MDTTFSANEQRQTVTLNYEISAIWETMPRATSQTTSRHLTGPETGHEA